MIIRNSIAEVSITDVTALAKINENQYDAVLETNRSCKELRKAFSVTISSEKTYSYLLVNYCYTQLDHCAILDNDRLLVLMDDVLTVFNVNTGNLLLQKRYNQFCTYFRIYSFDNAYIIHGECEIVKLNRDYEIEWRFSGRDIFVRQSADDAFVISGDVIQLYDFYDNYYEIDKSGKLIKEISSNNE
jgi:hypothetical protein